jgi:hypothetical protein
LNGEDMAKRNSVFKQIEQYLSAFLSHPEINTLREEIYYYCADHFSPSIRKNHFNVYKYLKKWVMGA